MIAFSPADRGRWQLDRSVDVPDTPGRRHPRTVAAAPAVAARATAGLPSRLPSTVVLRDAVAATPARRLPGLAAEGSAYDAARLGHRHLQRSCSTRRLGRLPRPGPRRAGGVPDLHREQYLGTPPRVPQDRPLRRRRGRVLRLPRAEEPRRQGCAAGTALPSLRADDHRTSGQHEPRRRSVEGRRPAHGELVSKEAEQLDEKALDVGGVRVRGTVSREGSVWLSFATAYGTGAAGDTWIAARWCQIDAATGRVRVRTSSPSPGPITCPPTSWSTPRER